MPDRPTDDIESLSDPGSESVRSVAEAESDAGSPTAEIVRHGGTFESFRHRAYTLFWSGALVSNVGTWMQAAVIGLIAYGFRHSEADLGLVTFASQIPALFLALPGGVLADRVDKRKLIIWAQVLLMFQAIAFGALYVTGHLSASTPIASLAWVSFLGLVAGVLTSLSFPAWQAIIPDLVPRPVLLNAIALNSAQFQSARMLGPVAAFGVMLVAGSAAGMADVFWINAISFLFVIGALMAVRVAPHAPDKRADAPREGMWTSLKEGVRYAATHRMIGIVILSTAIMTFVGMPYVFLMPAVADKVLGFHGVAAYTPINYVLLTANGLGALVRRADRRESPALDPPRAPHALDDPRHRDRADRVRVHAVAVALDRAVGAGRRLRADHQLPGEHVGAGQRPAPAARARDVRLHHVLPGGHAAVGRRVRPAGGGHRDLVGHRRRRGRAAGVGARAHRAAVAAHARRGRATRREHGTIGVREGATARPPGW